MDLGDSQTEEGRQKKKKLNNGMFRDPSNYKLDKMRQ